MKARDDDGMTALMYPGDVCLCPGDMYPLIVYIQDPEFEYVMPQRPLPAGVLELARHMVASMHGLI